MTTRELVDSEMAARVVDGRVMQAIDRGLASKDDRVARDTASLVLDRLLGRPVAVTEAQIPGTQAYVELRRTLDALEPADRLTYLRESRMAAGLAMGESVLPAQGVPMSVVDPDPARALVEGEGALVVGEEEDAHALAREEEGG